MRTLLHRRCPRGCYCPAPFGQRLRIVIALKLCCIWPGRKRSSRVVFTVNENLAALIRERFKIRFGDKVMAFFLLS